MKKNNPMTLGDANQRRTLFAWSVLVLITTLVVGNLGALIDLVLHPEIEYFDPEHLLVGLSSALVVGTVLVLLFGYAVRLEKAIRENKRMEALLRKEADFHKNLMAITPIGISTLDRDGNIRSANLQAENILGLSKSELANHTYNSPTFRITDLHGGIFPDDQLPFQQVKTHGKSIFDVQHAIQSPNGHRVSLSINAAPLVDDAGHFDGIITTMQDITEHKRSEARIASLALRNETLLRASSDGVHIVNGRGDVVEVNDAFCRMLGYTREEALTLNVVDWDTLIPQDALQSKINGLLGKQEIFETVHRRRDGTLFDGEINATGVEIETKHYLYVAARDITERKEMERAIRANERLLKNIFSSSTDHIYLKDRQLHTIGCNDALARFIGKRPEELIGKTDTDNGWNPEYVTGNPDKGVRGFEQDDRAVLNGEIVHVVEELSSMGQAPRIFDTIKLPIQNDEGTVVGVLGISRDITVQRKAGEEIKHLLGEKELLLKEVHHRIKNNMSTMKSLLSLQAFNQKNEAARIAIKDAESRLKSMIVLYDRLYREKDFTSLTIDEYLSTLTDDLISTFSNRDIVKVETTMAAIRIGSKHMSSVGMIVNELITNTMKHAFTGRDAGLILISASIDGKRVSISIKDDGVGIPESFNIETSPGFGLQLVQTLTEQLDGSFRVERENGTKWTLEFDV